MEPADEEEIRRALFPDMTTEEYREMVRRNRAEFQRLPPERQARIRATVGTCATCGYPDEDASQSPGKSPIWQCPACGRAFYTSDE
ncbi:hypothetical protein Tamer19_42410 [Cupriavidus sp. TA19]|uniref:hypothetical protein n=1 Tax=unclassified Cupriavidus TaxID=2640874 RepID=UPI000E2F0299|nr:MULTISPECIES: hypothetical protein [unclassified Cupriavidus]BDB30471.1 hypothetical protein CTP10_R78880 [Cupriavidus sp. P-10]GLC94833.1 hypothetical protein Tamer19_42410 [Cupriavidus sp. TA19]